MIFKVVSIIYGCHGNKKTEWNVIISSSHADNHLRNILVKFELNKSSSIMRRHLKKLLMTDTYIFHLREGKSSKQVQITYTSKIILA